MLHFCNGVTNETTTNLDRMNMGGGEQLVKERHWGCLQPGLLIHSLSLSILLQITHTKVVTDHLNTAMLTYWSTGELQVSSNSMYGISLARHTQVPPINWGVWHARLVRDLTVKLSRTLIGIKELSLCTLWPSTMYSILYKVYRQSQFLVFIQINQVLRNGTDLAGHSCCTSHPYTEPSCMHEVRFADILWN